MDMYTGAYFRAEAEEFSTRIIDLPIENREAAITGLTIAYLRTKSVTTEEQKELFNLYTHKLTEYEIVTIEKGLGHDIKSHNSLQS